MTSEIELFLEPQQSALGLAVARAGTQSSASVKRI